MPLYYFAYGSNMSGPRLSARIGSARKLGVARLQGHALRFHKRGRDGSAKCDAHATGDPLDQMMGVVYRIDESDRAALDRFEGCGHGYESREVSVTLADGRSVEAFAYHATDVDAGLRPYHWYKAHVVRGASEHDLPHAYLEAIHAVESVDDPNHVRHAAEMAIYGDTKSN